MFSWSHKWSEITINPWIHVSKRRKTETTPHHSQEVLLSMMQAASARFLASRDLPEAAGTFKMVPAIGTKHFEVAGENLSWLCGLFLLLLFFKRMSLLNSTGIFKTTPVIGWACWRSWEVSQAFPVSFKVHHAGCRSSFECPWCIQCSRNIHNGTWEQHGALSGKSLPNPLSSWYGIESVPPVRVCKNLTLTGNGDWLCTDKRQTLLCGQLAVRLFSSPQWEATLTSTTSAANVPRDQFMAILPPFLAKVSSHRKIKFSFQSIWVFCSIYKKRNILQ